MTLVVGFRCRSGGVLLCADREENDGYNKREVDKIYRIPCTQLQHCDVFLAGAGSGDFIRKAQARIHDRLVQAAEGGQDVFAEHQKLIESSLRDLHREYAKQLKESGGIWFVVVVAAFKSRLVPLMYATKESTLIPRPVYAACGTGQPIADYFADRLFEYDKMDKVTLGTLAAFILREAEASAAGVGLGNDMVFIHDGDGSLHFIPKDYVREIQEAIPKLEDAIFPCWRTHVKVPDWLAK